MDMQSAIRRRAKTIDEFCESNRFSRATYYNLKGVGLGPKIIKVGRKTIITDDAEEAWHRMMERRTAEAEGAT